MMLQENSNSLANFPSKTELRCAKSCLRNPQCKSFNFCSQRCNLNQYDIFSRDAQLIPNIQCTYGGMKRRSQPKCKEKGVEINIQNDATPGDCEINLKRTDFTCELVAEEEVTVNETNEWRVYQNVSYEYSAHGGFNVTCLYGYTGIHNFEWLVWVRNQRRGITGALEYCRTVHNGTLFGDLDGSNEQLDFLKLHMKGLGRLWLGITRISPGKWETFYGKDITSNIKWFTGQPSNMALEHYAIIDLNVAIHETELYHWVADIIEDDTRYVYAFICDKLH